MFCVLIIKTHGGNDFEFPAGACVTALTGNYMGCKVHNWGEDTPMTICNNSCKGQEIMGSHTAKSRNDVMQGAIQDFKCQHNHFRNH
ncbi:hypothetical protein I4U23_015490 [Adineta vaga]|nr:hypothetical protein I4U23_015490 [Adineta vaga]